MIVAPRAFRDEEFRVPYELLNKIGYKIYVASRDTIIAVGIKGLALKPHLAIRDIDTTKYDGIIFVGGTGAAIYWDDKNVHQLVQYFAQANNKIVAAICIAPVILARAGVLKDIKATVFEDRKMINELKQNGALYQKSDVVVCKNIITASGPTAATAFTKAIVSKLTESYR
ncbi:MAG: DJ-1/PfpI family protein [candidate division WOR-3 bacterium]